MFFSFLQFPQSCFALELVIMSGEETELENGQEKSAIYLVDSSGYIKPCLQDVAFTDINSNELKKIATAMDLEYLGPASFPGSFPAEGRIWAPNHMVNLACCPQTKSNSLNIIFLLVTGSPVTYLSQEAMESLIGNESKLPETLFVKIHTEKAIQTYISPKNSHFAEVNVLGMDFIVENRVYPRLDFKEKTFSLY